jgi:hypothetical protein
MPPKMVVYDHSIAQKLATKHHCTPYCVNDRKGNQTSDVLSAFDVYPVYPI